MSAAPRFASGFTLLEIMVVLVLIGVMTGFALLSAGGRPQERLAEEAQRLAALLELHRQEAILNGEPRGVRFHRAGYAILRLDQHDQWQAPTAADALTQRNLPEDMVLGLWVEGRPAALSPAGEPQVVLLNSGESTEFVAVFSLSDERGPDAPFYRVAGDLTGRLTVSAATR